LARNFEDLDKFRNLQAAQEHDTNSLIETIKSLGGSALGHSVFGKSEADQRRSIQAVSAIISGQLKSLADQLKHPESINNEVSKLVDRGEFSFAFVIPEDSVHVNENEIHFKAKAEVVWDLDDPSVVEPVWPTAEGSYYLTRAENGGWSGTEVTGEPTPQPTSSANSRVPDRVYMLERLSNLDMTDPENLIKLLRSWVCPIEQYPTRKPHVVRPHIPRVMYMRVVWANGGR